MGSSQGIVYMIFRAKSIVDTPRLATCISFKAYGLMDKHSMLIAMCLDTGLLRFGSIPIPRISDTSRFGIDTDSISITVLLKHP